MPQARQMQRWVRYGLAAPLCRTGVRHYSQRFKGQRSASIVASPIAQCHAQCQQAASNPACAKAELRNPVIRTTLATWMHLTTGAQAPCITMLYGANGVTAAAAKRKGAQRACDLRSLRATTVMRPAAPDARSAWSQQRLQTGKLNDVFLMVKSPAAANSTVNKAFSDCEYSTRETGYANI